MHTLNRSQRWYSSGKYKREIEASDESCRRTIDVDRILRIEAKFLIFSQL